jgi:hypothetical protein
MLLIVKEKNRRILQQDESYFINIKEKGVYDEEK